MSMYNLIENRDNYSKNFGILWQYYRDEPALAANEFTDITKANSVTDVVKIKEKTTGVNGSKYVKK